MRHEHVYALNVLNVRSYLHFFGGERPPEAAERLAETNFFIVNVRGGRTEPFGNLFRISVYKVYPRSVERVHRGEKIAFRLHERLDEIFSVQMPYVNKPVFVQKIGYYVKISLFVKFRDGFIIIASRFNRNRAHILPQTAQMRADVVTEFFDKPRCEIVRPDYGVKVFALLEIVLIKSGFVGEKTFDNLSPLLFKPLFIFRMGEFNEFARCGGI